MISALLAVSHDSRVVLGTFEPPLAITPASNVILFKHEPFRRFYLVLLDKIGIAFCLYDTFLWIFIPLIQEQWDDAPYMKKGGISVPIESLN